MPLDSRHPPTVYAPARYQGAVVLCLAGSEECVVERQMYSTHATTMSGVLSLRNSSVWLSIARFTTLDYGSIGSAMVILTN